MVDISDEREGKRTPDSCRERIGKFFLQRESRGRTRNKRRGKGNQARPPSFPSTSTTSVFSSHHVRSSSHLLGSSAHLLYFYFYSAPCSFWSSGRNDSSTLRRRRHQRLDCSSSSESSSHRTRDRPTPTGPFLRIGCRYGRGIGSFHRRGRRTQSEGHAQGSPGRYRCELVVSLLLLFRKWS